MKINYYRYKHLIETADLLLFKPKPFPSVGWVISKYTDSQYSHAALADWRDNDVVCLEFREFCGSRVFPLSEYLKMGYVIDVFRACSKIIFPTIINVNHPFESIETKIFDRQTKENIVNTAYSLIGKKYSWWTIWQLAKTYMPFIRLGQIKSAKNGEPNSQKFVCSTLVSYAYRINYIDPVPFLSDSYTTPGDLSRSTLFTKLFQIV
jgi:hypothetical protein